jgi:hypothetical protein
MNMHQPRVPFALYVYALILLTACGTGGPQAPRDVPEAIGETQTMLTTVAKDVRNARVSGLISDSEAKTLQTQLQSAQNDINFSIDAYALNHQAESDSYVNSAHLMLQSIITILQRRGATTTGGI